MHFFLYLTDYLTVTTRYSIFFLVHQTFAEFKIYLFTYPCKFFKLWYVRVPMSAITAKSHFGSLEEEHRHPIPLSQKTVRQTGMP